VPTGVALRDARRQLFDAAERVLVRDGPQALTSRAVTAEAGVAKGVLHRHFADFDAFLADLVDDRRARLEDEAAALVGTAGGGNIVDNLARALTSLFSTLAVGIVALIISRDELRSRLRRARPGGIPLLHEATAMVAAYLVAERDLGRVRESADIESLAPSLIGAAHLLFADQRGFPPEPAAVRRAVDAMMASALREPAG
jgi:AcrR family transcriptional regulator